MKWRVLGLETHDAYFNMALDEAISERVREGSSLPTIRFYNWSPNAVSIGYFQSIKDEVNLEVCMELGADCIRRWTGGGAVYHDFEGEITYSVIAPAKLFPKNIIESYGLICRWLVKGLTSLVLRRNSSRLTRYSCKRQENLRKRPDKEGRYIAAARNSTLWA